MTQGWLLAGIADAETQMSHCWSELTWACQGPSSPDCGGGPVVAGAGDGPCELRQGGLGMFQFDAGTFDDTLRREGDRILSIAGNTQAAVDFVVGMVIRSAYVDGVSNRDQAIEWMNGVRIGNGRWDPWIRTVTHYYNGCAPTYSCWSSRYEHYRSNTQGVYDEMGADFWTVSATEFAARYADQSFPLASVGLDLAPGEEVSGYIDMENTGAETWTPGATFLGTTQPRDGDSPLASGDWVNPHRAATVDAATPTGEVGRFAFTVRAPDTPGTYDQFFNLVQESVTWFGMPGDDLLQVRVRVTAAACPAGLGEAWECAETGRQRCAGGSVEFESCAFDCVDGSCDSGPTDEDGDGHNSSVDCDDTDPAVYPGAADPCDAIDQNCDGNDGCGPVTPDAGMGSMMSPDGGMTTDPSMRPTSGSIGGGCSTGGTGDGGLWLLLGLFFVRRRR